MVHSQSSIDNSKSSMDLAPRTNPLSCPACPEPVEGSLSKGLSCIAFCEAGPFTTVEDSLQIDPFMQNKPNLLNAQINVSSFITKDYRKNDAFAVQKNKANSNPNKPNLPEGKIDAKCVVTKDYEEKCG